jgi:hypothetical protein
MGAVCASEEYCHLPYGVNSPDKLNAPGVDAMKFAQNRLYIEAYIKCHNCGVLLFHDDKAQQAAKVDISGVVYCSDWCVDWASDRDERSKVASS